MGEPQYLKSTICKKGVYSIPLSASYSLACEKQGKERAKGIAWGRGLGCSIG